MDRITEMMEFLIVEGVYFMMRIACWNPFIARLLDRPVI